LRAGTFKYCVCARDASGNEAWDNNGGNDYAVAINE
jgi:hypothetical protein